MSILHCRTAIIYVQQSPLAISSPPNRIGLATKPLLLRLECEHNWKTSGYDRKQSLVLAETSWAYDIKSG